MGIQEVIMRAEETPNSMAVSKLWTSLLEESWEPGGSEELSLQGEISAFFSNMCMIQIPATHKVVQKRSAHILPCVNTFSLTVGE